MRLSSRNHLFFLLCAMFLSGGQALAQDGQNGNDDRPRPPGQYRRPPEAAFSACSDLKENDVCEVQRKERSIDGRCVPARDDKRDDKKEDNKLVCLPDHPQGPLPEAQSACANKSTGDSCSFTGPDGRNMPEGVCSEGADGLHCRPSAPPRDR